jgi:hypothetical protein
MFGNAAWRNLGMLLAMGLLSGCGSSGQSEPAMRSCGAVSAQVVAEDARRMEYQFATTTDGPARWADQPTVYVEPVFGRIDPNWGLLRQSMGRAGFDHRLETREDAPMRITAFVNTPDCTSRADGVRSYFCRPENGDYYRGWAFRASNRALDYYARENTPRVSDIALLWFPSADVRNENRRNVHGFVIVNSEMQIIEAQCFLNVDLPLGQLNALYRECLLRAFGLGQFSGSGGPRILQARGAADPDWSVAGWEVGLMCLHRLYAGKLASEPHFDDQ